MKKVFGIIMDLLDLNRFIVHTLLLNLLGFIIYFPIIFTLYNIY